MKLHVWNRLGLLPRPFLLFFCNYFLRGGFLDARDSSTTYGGQYFVTPVDNFDGLACQWSKKYAEAGSMRLLRLQS
jgi:hypothetical protein